MIAQSAARKRGKPKSQVTRDQNEWFRQANILAKYAPGAQQWIAIRIAKGGPWYPRDLLMSAMAGRLFEQLEIDGQIWTSMAVVQDVSDDLDFVGGKALGTLLVRGPDRWQALLPGAEGQALTSGGPEALPGWAAGGGGGGLIVTQNEPNVGVSGAPFATKGYLFVASQPFKMVGMGTNVISTSGHTYRGGIYKVDGANKITSIEALTPAVVAAGGGSLWLSQLLASTVDMVAGQRYFMAWSRTDGAGTFGLPLRGANLPGTWPALPVAHFDFDTSATTAGRLAKAVPAVNDTVNLNTAGMFVQVPILSI